MSQSVNTIDQLKPFSAARTVNVCVVGVSEIPEISELMIDMIYGSSWQLVGWMVVSTNEGTVRPYSLYMYQ